MKIVRKLPQGEICMLLHPDHSTCSSFYFDFFIKESKRAVKVFYLSLFLSFCFFSWSHLNSSNPNPWLGCLYLSLVVLSAPFCDVPTFYQKITAHSVRKLAEEHTVLEFLLHSGLGLGMPNVQVLSRPLLYKAIYAHLAFWSLWNLWAHRSKDRTRFLCIHLCFGCNFPFAPEKGLVHPQIFLGLVVSNHLLDDPHPQSPRSTVFLYQLALGIRPSLFQSKSCSPSTSSFYKERGDQGRPEPATHLLFDVIFNCFLRPPVLRALFAFFLCVVCLSISLLPPILEPTLMISSR